MKAYLYRCPKHGEFLSALQKGAACPTCGRKGVRQFAANIHFHPSKGAS